MAAQSGPAGALRRAGEVAGACGGGGGGCGDGGVCGDAPSRTCVAAESQSTAIQSSCP